MPVDAAHEAITEIISRDASGLKLRSRKIRVDVVAGPQSGQSFDLAGPEVRVGSARGAELLLLDGAVSRHHLTLRVERGRVRVIDAGSRNGTLLDGVSIRDAYARADSSVTAGNTQLRINLLHDEVLVPLSSRERFGALVGTSPAMRVVFTLLERAAAVDDTVLLEGETGTGKELAAEALHEESARSGGPFVVFDCSAVAPTLMESELFGHVRGAFSGAVADREGALEAADGGTLFLDEIGELPVDLQPKLLRALERLEVRRVGSNAPVRVDVRVVAATNRNLAEEVARRAFREDLYYRLAVVRVALPPLRERPEDIPLLVEHFCRQRAQQGRPVVPFGDRVVRGLMGQAWPGNVRELKNAVARAISIGAGAESAGPASVPASAAVSGRIDLSVPLKEARDRMCDLFEEQYLRLALTETGGNVSQAARLAGVNRKFIQRAVRRFGLRADDDEE
ncbi:MAG: sigma 54-dependent Fis family transcriptional regulator [Polyangiaceae bacterium]|jgi:DNA-binding NtrC family response regulator|nr:sigma 54-dependent Fis family transcriptional regulator [Polyangiaceae bacterium]MBK8941055.1 sigma 54-dependent Fis family transcriptional regulator [Polyangiaceae bacterium]